MIKQLKLVRWKSFENSVLFIDPLTVLIGLNASGKSNALDALQFLQRSVTNRDLYTALAGDRSQPEIRGGLEWIVLRGHDSFKLEVQIGTDDPNVDYYYCIEVGIVKISTAAFSVYLKSEELFEILQRKRSEPTWKRLFWTDPGQGTTNPTITVRLKNKRGVPREMSVNTSVLSQLRHAILADRIDVAINQMALALEQIFILDPIPQKARSFSKIEQYLNPDGSNLAGVIAAMDDRHKKDTEGTLSRYAKDLPEREIERVWVEPAGLMGTDAMLYCEERYQPTQSAIVDIRGLSDGTLRFLAILTAVLTRSKGSLLVIEEIDNGIHPSRAKLLLEILLKEGKKAGIDILATTHNPAFLDQLVPNLLPFVMLAHRDDKTGASVITPLEEAEKLHFLMGKGTLGDIATNERLYEQLIEN